MLEIVAGIIGLFWLVEAIFSMTYRKPKPALRDQRRRAERHEYTAERFGLKMTVTEYKDPIDYDVMRNTLISTIIGPS